MKNTKHILCVLLAILLIPGIAPVSVYAENDTQTKTGESVWWSYDDSTDTLTISDTPAAGRSEFTVDAQKWADVYNMPWNVKGKWYSNMKTVVIDGNPRPAYIREWFCNASKLTSIRNLNGLDTSCVTSMQSLFNSCTKLTQIDLSGFQTENVTDFSYMFVSCVGLSELDLSSFDTSAATGFPYMFSDCSGLTELDLSGFSVQNNISCNNMFERCESLKTLKLFSIQSDCYMISDSMFADCSALETIFAPCTSVWNTRYDNFTFYDCAKLSGGKGSSYAVYGTNPKDMFRFDGGENAPGYLTPMHPQKAEETKRENEVASGCETTGSYDEVVYCTACNQELSRKQIPIPAKGHSYVDHDAKAPTCTEIGWDAYQTCENCVYTTYKELSATGHSCVCHEKKEATCTDDGYEAYFECEDCGKLFSDEEYQNEIDRVLVIPASGHEDADNDGICDHCGDKMYGDNSCALCGKLHDGGTLKDTLIWCIHRIIYRILNLLTVSFNLITKLI